MSETKELSIDDVKLEPQSDLDGVRAKAWGIGVIGLIACGALGYMEGGLPTLLRAYLVGWLFTLGVAVGLTALNMIGHLSGGDWHVAMRRVFEAAGRTLPLILVMGLPIIFLGPDHLYAWGVERITQVGHANYDPVVAGKAAFLNKPMFIGCSIAYIVIWWVLALLIGNASQRFDETRDPSAYARMKSVSAAGMIIYILTATLASVHWMMSLDPHWFSSLFGVAFAAGHGLSAWAISIPLMIFLMNREPMKSLVPKTMWTKLFHDYGKMVLAFTALWGYFTVSQLLIIWSGNLPEEVPWYLARSTHGWGIFSVILALGHFVIPFLILLSQDIKKQPGKIMWVAIWMLVMRWYDLFWNIAPATAGHGAESHVVYPVADFAAAVGLFGIWLGFLMTQLKGRAMVPVAEPALEEVVAHG